MIWHSVLPLCTALLNPPVESDRLLSEFRFHVLHRQYLLSRTKQHPSMTGISGHESRTMDEDPRDSSPPSKWELVEYLCYILLSDVEIRFSPSMRHRPPIVTRDEIRNARDLCPHAMGGCKILEINESTILKVGYTVQMGEAEAMCLLKQRTSIPVPQVFNAYMIEDIGFISMEKVLGVTFEQCWKGLTRDTKRSIVQQLQHFTQEWRKIEGPFFGTVDGGPCPDVLFKHPWHPKPRLYGPFPTRKEFNEGVVEALCNSRPKEQLTERDKPLAERILVSGQDSQGERKVFTHGDLHQSNIIVNDNVISGIIDWGAAGYSILAREYFGIRWQALDLDWRDLTSTILEVDEYDFWAQVNQSMVNYTGI